MAVLNSADILAAVDHMVAFPDIADKVVLVEDTDMLQGVHAADICMVEDQLVVAVVVAAVVDLMDFQDAAEAAIVVVVGLAEAVEAAELDCKRIVEMVAVAVLVMDLVVVEHLPEAYYVVAEEQMVLLELAEADCSRLVERAELAVPMKDLVVVEHLLEAYYVAVVAAAVDLVVEHQHYDLDRDVVERLEVGPAYQVQSLTELAQIVRLVVVEVFD